MSQQVEGKVSVTQSRSGIGHTKRQKETLKALGLGKIGRTKVHELTPSTRGMIRSVSHLVTVHVAE